MSQPSGGKARKPRRFAPLIVVAGLVGALAMSLAMTNTLSAFIATIVNTNDTAAAGSVVLQEANADASTTCSSDSTNVSTNSSNCATINKYGGSTTMVPTNANATSNLVTTTVNFKNTGSSAATAFTMGFGACTQSNNGASNGTATDYCSKLHVKVTSGSTVIQADSTAAALANTTVTLPTVPGANSATTVPFTFTVYLDTSAGNTYQGLKASQPITWTLSS